METTIPFLFGFFERVEIVKDSAKANVTEYSTSSGSRESGYDEDP